MILLVFGLVTYCRAVHLNNKSNWLQLITSRATPNFWVLSLCCVQSQKRHGREQLGVRRSDELCQLGHPGLVPRRTHRYGAQRQGEANSVASTKNANDTVFFKGIEWKRYVIIRYKHVLSMLFHQFWVCFWCWTWMIFPKIRRDMDICNFFYMNLGNSFIFPSSFNCSGMAQYPCQSVL